MKMNQDLDNPTKETTPFKKLLKKIKRASIARKDIGSMYIDGKSVFSTLGDTFCSVNVYVALFLTLIF
jgi:hypothetical protein